MKTGTALCVVLLMIVQGHCLSDGVIRGRVVDSEGAVIPRASIRVLDETSRSTLEALQSDANGNFVVGDRGNGHYLIVVSAPGFADKWSSAFGSGAGAGTIETVRMNAEDCDAPTVSCDILSDTPVPDAHPIVSRGRLTVDVNGAVDLERGRLVSADSTLAGIRLSESGSALFITPLHRARIASECGPHSAFDKGEGGTSPFRIDGLGPRTEICLRTGGARSTKVFITREVHPGDKQINIFIVTRADEANNHVISREWSATPK